MFYNLFLPCADCSIFVISDRLDVALFDYIEWVDEMEDSARLAANEAYLAYQQLT